MLVNGNECSLVIKNANHEFTVPYAEETVREAIIFLTEETPIEGDGNYRAIQKKSGVTGCIVTPLTIKTAPLLLYIAFGFADKPVFKSETRNTYSHLLRLNLLEDSDCFDVIQDRGINNEQFRTEGSAMSNGRKIYKSCKAKSFELRILREEAVKLKLDICGEHSGIPLRGIPLSFASQNSCDILQQDKIETENEIGERFDSNYVDYRINGKEYRNIYGLTMLVKKDKGVKTEIWIRRAIELGNDVPEKIDELIISARLLNDKYEFGSKGLFRITLKKLVFVSDETNVNSADAVIGSLRYVVCGAVTADVFTNSDDLL